MKTGPARRGRRAAALALTLALAAGAWHGLAAPAPAPVALRLPPPEPPRVAAPDADPVYASAPWAHDRGAPAAAPVPDPLAGDAADHPPLSQDALRANADAVALAEAGDLAGAAALLRDLLLLHPGHPLLQRNLRAVLLNSAEQQRRDGDLAAAEALVLEALELGPIADAWILLGSIRRETGDPAGAAEAWDQALTLAPQRTDVALGLAEMLAAVDQRDRALDVLFAVRDAGHDSDAVDALVARLSRELDAEWDYVRVDTDHFHVDFDAGVAAETVDFVAAALDDAWRDVSARLGVHLDERARAVLYPDADFHALTQTPDWAKGVFDGRIKIPLGGLEAGDPGLPAVLRHEYAHHVIAALARGRAPVWLNEGLAMWAEGDGDERLLWAEERLAGATFVPLARLQGSFARLPAGPAELAYAQSYVAVRRLADDYGPDAVVDVLRRLGAGTPFAEAFRAVYRTDPDAFEDRLRAELARDYGVASGG